MINEMWAQNFQSHKDTHVVFDKGVNAIVGLSDSGKTALLRGLLWLMTNKPSGEEFRSYWGGDTKVRIRIGEIFLERGRTDNDNYYRLDVPGQTEPRYFRAFGQGDPPQEILEALNLNEFNIARQMDAAFLISESEGEVARILNRAVNLDVIDTSMSAMRSKKDKVRRALEAEESNVKRLEEELGQFDDIEGMDADVDRLEVIRAKRQEVLTKIRHMTEAVTNLRRIQLEQRKHFAIVGATNALQAAIECQEKQRQVHGKVERLSETLNQINIATRNLRKVAKLRGAEQEVMLASYIGILRCELSAQIERLEEIGALLQKSASRHKNAVGLFSAEMLVNLVADTSEKRVVNASQIQRLKAAISGVLGSEHVLRATKERLKRLRDEFDAEMPEECPLCGAYTAP